MKFVSKYRNRLLACALLIVLTAGIIIYVSYQSKSDDKDISESDVSESIRLYEEIISPAMLTDSVSTIFSVGDDKEKLELRYAISGINSLVSYSKKDEDGSFKMLEVWNDTEQYYLKVAEDDTVKSYKIDVTEDSRKELNEYIYGCYITISSYLGVANKNRIVNFQILEDGTYLATSNIEDLVYELHYTLTDGKLSNIQMYNNVYDDRPINIKFDKFDIFEQSSAQDTNLVCDVEYVGEVFDNIMSE